MPRTPLLRPGEYFAERPLEDELLRAAAVVGLVALLTTAAAGGLLWALTQQLDVTTSVENPAHTPEWVCENRAATDVPTPDGCGEDVPETVERNLGDLVWEELSGYLPVLLFVPFVGWIVAAVLAHAATAFAAGAEGSFARTLAVSGWAAAPNLAQLGVVSTVFYLRLRSGPAPSTPEAAVSQLETVVSVVNGPLLTAVLLAVAVWKAVIWAAGLRRARNVSPGAAWTIAAVGAALSVLTSAAN